MRVLYLQMDGSPGSYLAEQMGLIPGQDSLCCLTVNCRGVCDRSILCGDEVFLEDLLQYCRMYSFSCIVIPDSVWSRQLAVRLARRLRGSCQTGVCRMHRTKNGIWTEWDAYQANMLAGREYGTYPLVVTSRMLPNRNAESSICMEHRTLNLKPGKQDRVPDALKKEKENPWEKETVLVCGYGIGGRAHAQQIRDFAELHGFGLGATRPVVANGWLPPEYLVGISGAVIGPKVCLVLGASGSQAFLAGISASQKIISVNLDGKAPIFQKSDIGIVGDCMDFLENWRKAGGAGYDRAGQ